MRFKSPLWIAGAISVSIILDNFPTLPVGSKTRVRNQDDKELLVDANPAPVSLMSGMGKKWYISAFGPNLSSQWSCC
jgi:hypothetical protein